MESAKEVRIVNKTELKRQQTIAKRQNRSLEAIENDCVEDYLLSSRKSKLELSRTAEIATLTYARRQHKRTKRTRNVWYPDRSFTPLSSSYQSQSRLKSY